MDNNLKLFQRSAKYLWTDPHISKEMLKAHLDPSHDGASRKQETIKKTVDWIDKNLPEKVKILDLGCGPGLYTSLLDERGHRVSGYDINPFSIHYAMKEALKTNSAINYRCLDYLKEDFGTAFDAIIMIYCDFGALIPSEQKLLLKKIKRALQPGGRFIFDVFGEGLNNIKEEHRQWSYETEEDFWGKRPRFELEESKHFKKEKVWGDRNIILEEDRTPKEYITWDQYYSEEEIKDFLRENEFTVIDLNNKLIPGDPEGGDFVRFIVAQFN